MATPLSYASKVQQHPQELEDFLQFVRSKKIQSYCEIGCKFGGLAWQVAHAMIKPTRIVLVDMPNQAWGRSDSLESLQNCADALRKSGHDVHLFIGDSRSSKIIKRVNALRPMAADGAQNNYDLLFIDANHTEPYVRADFAAYGTLADIVCFHDIGWNNPTPPGRLPIEVPKVWADIKKVYQFAATFQEIKHDKGHNGIGIMQWAD